MRLLAHRGSHFLVAVHLPVGPSVISKVPVILVADSTVAVYVALCFWSSFVNSNPKTALLSLIVPVTLYCPSGPS